MISPPFQLPSASSPLTRIGNRSSLEICFQWTKTCAEQSASWEKNTKIFSTHSTLPYTCKSWKPNLGIVDKLSRLSVVSEQASDSCLDEFDESTIPRQRHQPTQRAESFLFTDVSTCFYPQMLCICCLIMLNLHATQKPPRTQPFRWGFQLPLAQWTSGAVFFSMEQLLPTLEWILNSCSSNCENLSLFDFFWGVTIYLYLITTVSNRVSRDLCWREIHSSILCKSEMMPHRASESRIGRGLGSS